jgi:hypothetical protein
MTPRVKRARRATGPSTRALIGLVCGVVLIALSAEGLSAQARRLKLVQLADAIVTVSGRAMRV